LNGGVGVIACFGEQLSERQAGDTIKVVKESLDAIKGNFDIKT
jgi:triosephosphate isomerase